MHLVKFLLQRRFSSNTKLHIHQGSFEFHYVVDGDASFVIAGDRNHARNGSFFFVPPGVPHRLALNPGTRAITKYTLRCVFEDFGEETQLAEYLRKHVHSTRNFIQIGSTKRYVFEEIRRRMSSGTTFLQEAGTHLLLSFLYDVASKPKADQGPAKSNQIEYALKRMHNSVETQLRIEDLCAEVGLSRSYLIRLFADRVGITPKQYFIRLKIETACGLLIDTDMSVQDIAAQVGLSDPFYFSRCFKKHIGSSPSYYRARHLA